jgi:hypothetical protein
MNLESELGTCETYEHPGAISALVGISALITLALVVALAMLFLLTA